jgi:hypothetical protein
MAWHAVVVVVGGLEAEPAVEAEGRGVVLLDLEVEVAGPVVGGPAGSASEQGGGDAAAAGLWSGGHAEDPGPAPFDHQHADAEDDVVVHRGEKAGLGADPVEHQPAGGLGVLAALDHRPASEPSRVGGGGDRHGQGSGSGGPAGG